MAGLGCVSRLSSVLMAMFEQAASFGRVCGKGKNFGICLVQKLFHDIF